MIILIVNNKNLLLTSFSLNTHNINSAAVVKINKGDQMYMLTKLNLALKFKMGVSLLVIELEQTFIRLTRGQDH